LKIEIKHLSSHQNAKVQAVMMALISAIFCLPFGLLVMVLPSRSPTGGSSFMSGFFLLLLPVLYLVIGYIFTWIGCAIYNVVVKYTGGVEFEYSTDDRL
jgi:ABC-type Fe3+ transport system permease subunit